MTLKDDEMSEDKLPEPKRPQTSAKRPRRRLGGSTLALDAEQRKGYRRRWVNDEPGRIAEFQQAGYAHVDDESLRSKFPAEGHISTQVGGTSGPMVAYLMEQKEEYYDEDQAAKQAEIDKIDEQLLRGNPAGKLGDGGYIPEEGITIRRGR